MWYMHEGMSWWMIFGGVWMVVFWGGLIALIVWGITRLTGQGRPVYRHDPLDVAKERYAKGELSHEEFEHIKIELS